MPELPEVETVRRDLEALLVGRTITSVLPTGARTLRRYGDPAGFAARLAGTDVTAVRRVGKYLVVGAGDDDVVVHLGMSGQLRSAEPGEVLARHTHVVWRLSGGAELRFVDPRTFGEVFVSAGRAGGGLPVELAHLGPDALGVDAGGLAARLAMRRTRLKPLLLDQRFVAGIGNMYADEILWTARLSPRRPGSGLSVAAARRLHAAIGEVLLAAVAARGSSFADEAYRDLQGRIGGYQHHHRAYGREGLPCPRCGRPIQRRQELGRSTFSCPRCQR